MNTTKYDVIRHLQQLRATMAHALTQPNISPKRFNEIREQMLPLDVELHKLGVTDLNPVPQASPLYIRPTRFQRRQAKRGRSFTERMNRYAGTVKVDE